MTSAEGAQGGRRASGFKDYAARLSTLSTSFKSSRNLRTECRLVDVLSGVTCPPISLQDFELYLAYQELTLENLQFVVWYLDYCDRFRKLPVEQQHASPDPTLFAPREDSTAANTSTRVPATDADPDVDRSHWLGSLFARRRRNPRAQTPADNMRIVLPETPNPAVAPERPLSDMSLSSPLSVPASTPTTASSFRSLLRSPASTITTPSPTARFFKSTSRTSTQRASNLPTPFSPGFFETPRPSVAPEEQPFRDEALRVVATFMRPGQGRKELAIDESLRHEVFTDLALTTHPNVFAKAYKKTYDQLELSLQNFLDTQSANINFPKQIYWYCVGTTITCLSLAIAIIMIRLLPVINPHPPHNCRPFLRGARLASVPFATMGAMQLYSAWRGFCSEVFGRGHTQLKAWEMEDPAEAGVEMRKRKERADDAAPWMRGPPAVRLEDSDHSSNGSHRRREKDVEDRPPTTPTRSTKKPPVDDLDLIAPFEFSNSRSEAIPLDTLSSPIPSTSYANQARPIALDETLLSDSPPSSPETRTQKTSNPPIRVTLDASPAVQESGATATRPVPTHEIVLVKPRRRKAEDGYARPPVFGPERVILDERIKRYHAALLLDMIWFGFWYTVAFTAIVISVPGPLPKK
ncbi:hypothetical protein FRB99_000340 [Tulasnella sp. 403]|nr:hypothetical protein FRB99_000340 [Tulasnella sp. 403]